MSKARAGLRSCDAPHFITLAQNWCQGRSARLAEVDKRGHSIHDERRGRNWLQGRRRRSATVDTVSTFA